MSFLGINLGRIVADIFTFGYYEYFRLGFRAIEYGIKQLLPKPPGQSTDPVGDQVYNVSSRVNSAKLDSLKPEVFGETRVWFDAKSTQWTEYQGNDQLLHAWLHVSVGVASLIDLKVGDAPLTAFAGATAQLLKPGQAMTAFAPNVYTCDQVSDIDLKSGAGPIIESTAVFSVTAAAPTVLNGTFTNIWPGSHTRLLIIDGPNAGSYRVIAESSSSVTLDRAMVPDNATRTVQYSGGNANGDILRQDGLTATITPATSSITLSGSPGFSMFAVGDDIQLPGATAANNLTCFTILELSGDALTAVVTPTPAAAETGSATSVLLFRRYVGPYPSAPASDAASTIQIDVVCPQGLGSLQDNGTIAGWSVAVAPLYRPVDAYGNFIGPVMALRQSVFTAASRTPQRVTFTYTIPSQRAMVWLCRASFKTGNSKLIEEMSWTGLRGIVDPRVNEVPNVDMDSTTVAITLRSSGPLAGNGDHRINGTVARWLPTYVNGAWTPPVRTKSLVWAALYMLRGANGPQFMDSEIDLSTWLAAGTAWDALGQQFNGRIDNDARFLDVLQTLLRIGRAKPFRDPVTGKWTLYRDVQRTPTQLFASGVNAIHNGSSIDFRTASSPTGVLISYVDIPTWQPNSIGFGDTETAPQKVTLDGCTSRDLAYQEAYFTDACNRLRKRGFSFKGECEPRNLRVGDGAIYACRELQHGHGGTIEAVNGLTLTMFPPPLWNGTAAYVILADAGNVPSPAIAVTRGSDDSQLVLASAPTVAITPQVTVCAFGQVGDEPVSILCQNVDWKSLWESEVTALYDDVNVYANPGPTPIDPSPGYVGTPVNLAVGTITLTSTATTVTASFPPNGAQLYEVQWQYDGATGWVTAARGTQTTVTFAVSAPGVINVEVRAFGDTGQIGDFTYASINFAGNGSGSSGGALSVVANPMSDTVYGTTNQLTSDPITVMVQGGVPPYSIAAGNTAGLVVSQSGSMFTFTANVPAASQKSFTPTFTVTDSAGSTASTTETLTFVNQRSGFLPPTNNN